VLFGFLVGWTAMRVCVADTLDLHKRMSKSKGRS